MKRIVALGILLLATVSGGCGQKREGAAPPAPDAAEAPKATEHGGVSKNSCKELPDYQLPQNIDIQPPAVPDGIQGPA